MRARSEAGPGRRVQPIRLLVVSRVAEQATLGVASLLLARWLGPDAFVPVAVLFILNSLAIQVSDLGLGFGVLRSPSDRPLARVLFTRVRIVDGSVAVVGLVVGGVLGGDVGAVVAIGSVIWYLSAESYVRKTVALKRGRVRRLVVAEIVGTAVFAVFVAAAYFDLDRAVVLVGLGLLAKLATEALLLRDWRSMFVTEGATRGSTGEWLGQVMTYVIANVDYLLIGLLMSPEDLSRYVIAFRVASAAPALLASPLTQAAFIEMADTDPVHRQESYDGLVRRIAALGGLGVAVVAAGAPVVGWFLGSSWAGVGALMVILAWAIPWRLLLGPSVAMAVTAGKAWRVVAWESGRLVAVATAVVIGAQFGLVQVAAAMAGTTILALTIEHVLSTRTVDVDVRPLTVGAAGVGIVAVGLSAVVALA